MRTKDDCESVSGDWYGPTSEGGLGGANGYQDCVQAGCDTEPVVAACCGFGNNEYYQCSTFNVSENVSIPFWVRKESELRISEESICSWILGLNNGTLIAINGC